MSLTEGRENWVRVINRNSFQFTGRYDGRDYEFIPGVPVDLSEEAANHIFDLDKKDKRRAILRFGWANTGADMADAMAKMNKIYFDDPPEMIEAPRPPKTKRFPRTGTAAPAVNAGGSEGEAKIADPVPEVYEEYPLIKASPNGLRIGETPPAEPDEPDGEDDDEAA